MAPPADAPPRAGASHEPLRAHHLVPTETPMVHLPDEPGVPPLTRFSVFTNHFWDSLTEVLSDTPGKPVRALAKLAFVVAILGLAAVIPLVLLLALVPGGLIAGVGAALALCAGVGRGAKSFSSHKKSSEDRK